MHPRVTGLRGVELGVRDLKKTVEFYTNAWGLEEVSREGDTVYMRGTGAEHHILAVHERPKACLIGASFAADDRAQVDALYQKVKAFGAEILTVPSELSVAAGGGYGFSFRSLEGQPMMISCDVKTHSNIIADSSRPKKLTHVVLNSTRIDDTAKYFMDMFGFRLSDETDHMTFIRCSSSHHAVAIAKAAGPGLNHMAYEMENFDGLMSGTGRLKSAGTEVAWGVGRHGPGNNIFTYFVEPNGFATEYTTEVEQIDEATYQPHTKKYWSDFPNRPCRWNVATKASAAMRYASSGQMVEDLNNGVCDDIISRKLAGN